MNMRISNIVKLIVVGLLSISLIIFMGNWKNGGRTRQMQQQQLQNKLRLKEKTRPTKTYLKLDFSTSEPLIYELIIEMERKLPSLPLEYFYRHSNKVMEKFKNCAQYPAIQVLNFYNTYWQTFYTDNSIYHLYGAYYDERPKESGPVIRILAMSNHQLDTFPIIYCQLWFKDDNRPVLTTVKEYKLIWDLNWGIEPNVYYPYLMTCEIPRNINVTGDPIPKVVNLVQHQCDTAKNSLRIIYEKPDANEKVYDFAVCVKGLDFPYQDLSARLVEWLELLKILGVHKVFMYRLQVHRNINKVLDYYQKEGFVEVRDISLVGGVLEQPKLQHWLMKGYRLNRRLNEIIPYNDCFYRNMYKYKFIALLDIDEIIMPKDELNTWQELVASVHESIKNHKNCPAHHTTMCGTNVYFPKKVPDQEIPAVDIYPAYMYMLNHAYRFEDYTATHYNVKCLHNTQQVLTLHNHYPLSYLNTNCSAFDISTSYGQLQHYRAETSEEEIGRDHKIIRDENLQRFRKPLIENCKKVLRHLKLLISY